MRNVLKISFILVLSSSMVACTTGGAVAALLVGGVATGYYVGKDKRDINTIAKDVATTSTIKSWYFGDKDVKAFNINVNTYQGVVTLYGTVDTKAVEMRAMEVAAKAEGVTKVISKLTVLNEPSAPAVMAPTPERVPVSQPGGIIEELP
ncbi:MAG: BON domain-containing protein [Pseudomonadales bacterium]|nr:BON domain-containing protein [Pseudomonadales bacterium]